MDDKLLRIANALNVGEKEMMPHDGCTFKRKVFVYKNQKVYGYYCNKCKEDVKKPNTFGIEASLSFLSPKLEEETVTKALFNAEGGIDYKFPVETARGRNALWLYEHGISDSMISKYQIKYAPTLGRIILPIYENGLLKYYQARDITTTQSKKRPKYLNPEVGEKYSFWSKPLNNESIVITEDVLSAIKVGEVTRAVSILGTTLDDKTRKQVIDLNLPIKIWLDSDYAGVLGAQKVMDRFAFANRKVQIIYTHKDPKKYNRSEIQEILNV